MKRYASETNVDVSRSKAELDSLLAKHGAQQRLTAVDEARGRIVVQFGLDGRMVRMAVSRPVPEAFAPDDWKGVAGCTDDNRNRDENRRAWLDKRAQQAERATWRRLILIVKAKLELIAEGESTIEREFLADVLLPDGRTVHELIEQGLSESYRTGQMPALHPSLEAKALPARRSR